MGSLLFLTFFLRYLFVASAILNPTDFLALQSVRKGLHDLPGSTFFSGWDFTSDPCNFQGVLCDSDKVIALNLGDPEAGSPGLTGRIDSAIGTLSSLTELSLVPGRVYGSLPTSLSCLVNLRFLAISRNFLSGSIPSELSQISGLKTLDLSYNQLTGSIPSSIGTIPDLSNVLLCHNKLSGGVPIFSSQSLTRLDLKRNNLSGSIRPSSFPGSLQYLSLSSNRLYGPVDKLLTRLNQLNYVDLSANRFNGMIPGSIFSFPITTLQLQRNAFIGPVQPADQVVIPTVDLSYNRLSGEISPRLSTVQTLYLNNNRFTGRVPESFVNGLLASTIQTLYLHHNYLTGMAINPTADIPSTSSLCLQYNCMVLPVQTPCPLKAGLQKSRPTDQCIQWKA